MTGAVVRNDWQRILWQSLLTGLGFFLLGYGGIQATGHGRMIALIWPATAFAVSMIARLSRSRRQDIAMLAAICVAEACINFAMSAPPMVTLGFGIVSLLEVTAAVVAVRRFGAARFKDLKGGLRFLAAAILAPALMGAVLAACVMIAAANPDWLVDSRHWFAANVLGLCVVLPIGLAISWRKFAKLRLSERRTEALLVFTGLTLVSFIAIRWQAHPVPIIILPFALAAAVRFRLLGAGLAMALLLAIVLTSDLGAGTPAEYVARIERFQMFLAVVSLISTRTAMMLNERDVHLALIEGRRRSALRASRFKSQLLAHVGQEARGPLSAIIGISGVLESGKLAPERAQEFAHVVAHNGELLQRLYADLLDLARAEIADDLNVQADPRRLAQIINNLIANAYKYGDNDSPIRVRASRLGDGFGRIEILNTGPGIPMREREALFQPLAQEGGGRMVPGAGLGLSMAKVLAEKQGGRIDFESIPGRQTRFWIDLPLAA